MKSETWGIIGTSEKIKKILKIIRQVADTDVAVLIEGESGTGKEIVARAIHANSSRSSREMVSVNCGAIPEGILESELFGHEKGSFTGAISQRAGYFEMAHNGSIFLDEIGEMNLQTQVKLLRVLELGEYLRVGGSKTLKTDARVIAATNKHLEQEVHKGNFRQDLFYRLKSVTITMPPLRGRRNDIKLLTEKFISRLEEKYNTRLEGIAPEVMESFYNFNWPGNVRELKNLLESLILLKKGARIELPDLPENIRNSHAGVSGLPVYIHKTSDQAERELIYRALLGLRADVADLKDMLFDTLKVMRKHTGSRSFDNTLGDVSDYVDVSESSLSDILVKKVEADAINEALHRFNGNRKLAAKALGMSERTLYRRLKKL